MATYSAMRSSPTPTARSRRADKPRTNPFDETAKYIADVMWERAMELVEAMAPDTPTDAVEMEPYDMWNILEAAAAAYSPGYWDDPEALSDLFRLRKQFMGVADEDLKILARFAKQKQRMTPDVSVTPANPEFERQARTMGVA